MRRHTQLLGLAALATLTVALAVVAVGPQADDERAPTGAAKTTPLLRGIPQNGIALGDPKARVTMVEFADLQCPFCREYHEQVLPALVKRYVRTGKVRLELRLLRFIGPDSDRLARTAAGAAAKDRMWEVVGLAYARQGAENSGYADDEFLDDLVADAGLGAVDMGLPAEDLGVAGEDHARAAQIDSTPSFLVGPTGGELERFQPGSLSPDAFVGRLETALRR
jgi:protein-disulfide isomerase